MSIVIDASVARKWVFDEPGTEAALALSAEQPVAPALWLAEAANALWRHVRRGEIEPEEALARLDELADAPVASLSIEPHVARALRIATQIQHPVYLALAEYYDIDVVTDDRRFAAAAAVRRDLAARVRLLAG